jgi:hypothetical protein
MGELHNYRTYLVESVEFWTRSQCLRIIPKNHLGSLSGVDYHNRNVAQLNLIDVPVPFGP